MKRVTVYQGQIPLETDVLSTNRNTMIALGKLASGVLGINTLVNGLSCQPTTPASMNIQVSAGEIYTVQNIDDTAYGSLSADIVHQVMKQGILLDAVNLTLVAPTSPGKSINYLVQAAFEEKDGDSTVLPYYNSADPEHAFAGPGNNGASQPTTRTGSISVSAKAGVAGTTGNQSTPSADSGYTSLYIVSVAYGQTSIIASNITTVANAPFITETLTQKISKATADALYTTPNQVISMIQNYGSQAINLTGTNNAFTGATNPAITANTSIGGSLVVNFPTSITGAATLDLGGGATPLVDSQGNAFSATNTIAQGTAIIQFNRTTSKFVVIGIGGIDQTARNAAAAAGFTAGTRMPFAQAAAPTGWTQDTTDAADNRMLRVVKVAGNGVGGNHSPILNNVVPSHTHGFTTGNMSADHSHYVAGTTSGQSADHSHTAPSSAGSGQGAAGGNSVQQLGGTHQTYGTSNDHSHNFAVQSGGVSANHTHSGSTDNGSSQTNWTPRYIDMIICSKN